VIEQVTGEIWADHLQCFVFSFTPQMAQLFTEYGISSILTPTSMSVCLRADSEFHLRHTLTRNESTAHKCIWMMSKGCCRFRGGEREVGQPSVCVSSARAVVSFSETIRVCIEFFARIVDHFSE
jgi:hypothetical protein